MKEIYHCTPLELDQQPEDILNLHREMWNISKKEEYLSMKRNEQKSKQSKLSSKKYR